MEIIHGYKLLEPFTTANAGTASWTNAEKDGRKYFLKRFDSPKYTEEAREACLRYEARKSALYQALVSVDNGNIIYVSDFFREKNYYYSASEYVEMGVDLVLAVRRMDLNKKLVFMKTLAHSLMRIAAKGIVHSDLKPSNVMLKYTMDGYATAKLIDFDSGYLEMDPPEGEDVEGDLNYFSPEAVRAFFGEEVKLTSKSDVFALGIMFHEFFTGELPGITDDYESIAEAVLSGFTPRLSSSIPEEIRGLIAQMIVAEPDERLNAGQVFMALKRITEPEEEVSDEDILNPDSFLSDNVPDRQIVKKDGSEFFRKLGEL